MAGQVSDHLDAIKGAYRVSVEEGDRLVDELKVYGDELEHELEAWLTSSAAAVATIMDGHNRASSMKRALQAFRLTKLQ